jgi:uncharacterized protein YjiS (DUF1127 family)
MNPRDTQEQIGLSPAFAKFPNRDEVETIRMQAVQARDAMIAGYIRALFRGIGKVLAVIGTTLVSWPERRATYESLRMLTDRELADIGLTRGDISRVFEPGFKVPARPAKATPLASRRPRMA